MSNPSMPSTVSRVSVSVDVGDDVTVSNIAILDTRDYGGPAPTEGQAQVHIGSDMRLHVAGTPENLRRLAKVIEDAAMEIEAQLATDAAKARTLAHYSGLLDEARAEKASA